MGADQYSGEMAGKFKTGNALSSDGTRSSTYLSGLAHRLLSSPLLPNSNVSTERAQAIMTGVPSISERFHGLVDRRGNFTSIFQKSRFAIVEMRRLLRHGFRRM
jgi:hypothetical protein